MGCNSSKAKPLGDAATTSGHDENTGKAPSRNGFGRGRVADSDDASSSCGEEEVMAVKRSEPIDDAVSRAAQDKRVKAEDKAKRKSGFSFGFGSKAKLKVKQPWEDFGDDEDNESDLEQEMRKPTKPKPAQQKQERAPQPPPPPGPPPAHRNPSWLVEERGPMGVSLSPRTQRMMNFESSQLVDSRALSPTGGGGAHAVANMLHGNHGYERRYMDGVVDAPTPSKRQPNGRSGRRTDEQDEGPAKADPWANLQAKYTLDDVTPPRTPPRAQRLAMETLGESGDVLDVSMEYAGRGMRGRGRPGAAEMTWDGLEPVSNTALDEFAPMEEVADDEIDYRVRANELAMPKVQRRYGGNDAHRSSRRSGGRLDEEDATDEELNEDETLTFDSQPDFASRKQPNPRQHKPPAPQPQRGFRAPSPPHQQQQQQQQEEETLDFVGSGGGNSPPRMAKQGRRAGGGGKKPPMQMAGFGGSQGWDNSGGGFPNQSAGAFASQGGSQAFTLDDDEEDEELDLSSGPIKPVAIQQRRRGPMF